jgi:hypothetical protein
MQRARCNGQEHAGIRVRETLPSACRCPGGRCRSAFRVIAAPRDHSYPCQGQDTGICRSRATVPRHEGDSPPVGPLPASDGSCGSPTALFLRQNRRARPLERRASSLQRRGRDAAGSDSSPSSSKRLRPKIGRPCARIPCQWVRGGQAVPGMAQATRARPSEPARPPAPITIPRVQGGAQRGKSERLPTATRNPGGGGVRARLGRITPRVASATLRGPRWPPLSATGGGMEGSRGGGAEDGGMEGRTDRQREWGREEGGRDGGRETRRGRESLRRGGGERNLWRSCESGCVRCFLHVRTSMPA